MNGSEEIPEQTVAEYFEYFPELMQDIHSQTPVAQKNSKKNIHKETDI